MLDGETVGMVRGRTAAGWTAVGAAAVYIALQGDWVGGWTFGVEADAWLQDAAAAAQVGCAAAGLLVLFVGHRRQRRRRASGGAAHEDAPAQKFPLVLQVRPPAVVQVPPHGVGVRVRRVRTQPFVDGPPLRRHVPVP